MDQQENLGDMLTYIQIKNKCDYLYYLLNKHKMFHSFGLCL